MASTQRVFDDEYIYMAYVGLETKQANIKRIRIQEKHGEVQCQLTKKAK